MKRVRSLLKELVNWLSEKMAGIYNEADVYVTSSEWKNKWKELEVLREQKNKQMHRWHA